MKKRILYVFILLVAIGAVLGNYNFSGSPVAQPVSSVPTENPYVLTNNEKIVMEKIGKVPYITDVMFDETAEGSLIVSATAEIGTSPESDKKKLAKEIAYQFTVMAFQSEIPVAGASIHITSDNILLLGTSLGKEQQKKLSQTVVSGAAANGSTEFFQFLKQNETESTEPEKSTWFYELD